MPRVQQVQISNQQWDRLVERREHQSYSIRRHQRDISSHENVIAELQGAINQREHRIEEVNQDLEKISEYEVIDIQSVKEGLQSPYIDPRTIGLISRPNGQNVLRWVFSGLTCTADQNLMKLHGVPDSFPLNNCIVECDLRNYLFKIKPQTNKRRLLPHGYAGRKVVHPHILENDMPCLGDFRDQAIVALQERDYETLHIVLQAFLEQAYTGDAAGKTFYKHAAIHAAPHKRIEIDRYPFMSILDQSILGRSTYSRGRDLIYTIPVIDQGDLYTFEGTMQQYEQFLGASVPETLAADIEADLDPLAADDERVRDILDHVNTPYEIVDTPPITIDEWRETDFAAATTATTATAGAVTLDDIQIDALRRMREMLDAAPVPGVTIDDTNF